MRRNTRYIDPYQNDSPVIGWFWEVLGEYDLEHQAIFLKFLTGSSVLPLVGSLEISIARVPIDPNSYTASPLPYAHTCVMQLDLPEYASIEELRFKLTKAITMNNEGFAFA